MSLLGAIVYYRTKPVNDGAKYLLRVIEGVAANGLALAYRTVGPDQDWARTQAGLQPTDIELVDIPKRVEDAGTMCCPGTSLSVELRGSPVAQSMASAIEAGIPVAIRNGFLPCDLSVTVGEHDLFDYVERGTGVFYGRASASIKFLGYEIPYNCDEFRKRVFALQPVKVIEEKLAGILEQREKALIWSA